MSGHPDNDHTDDDDDDDDDDVDDSQTALFVHTLDARKSASKLSL